MSTPDNDPLVEWHTALRAADITPTRFEWNAAAQIPQVLGVPGPTFGFVFALERIQTKRSSIRRIVDADQRYVVTWPDTGTITGVMASGDLHVTQQTTPQVHVWRIVNYMTGRVPVHVGQPAPSTDLTTREQRARGYLRAHRDQITRIAYRTWRTPTSDGHAWYRVHFDADNPTCSCPDFEKGYLCKHIIAIGQLTKSKLPPYAP